MLQVSVSVWKTNVVLLFTISLNWIVSITSFVKKIPCKKKYLMINKTRLPVSGRNPECSDCLLRFIAGHNIKKLKVKKIKWKLFFLTFENFYENHPPTGHIKYKRIDFAPCNKLTMTNKLLSTNLERFLRRIKSPLSHY